MQSNAARIGVLIAVVAAAIVLFLVLSDGDDEGDGTTTAITATTTGATTVAEAPESITVADGEPVGGVKRFTHQSGDGVSIEVTVDQSVEEVHVHGYEITEPAAGDVPIRLAFTADIDGLFEIEAHLADGTDEPIAELRVNP